MDSLKTLYSQLDRESWYRDLCMMSKSMKEAIKSLSDMFSKHAVIKRESFNSLKEYFLHLKRLILGNRPKIEQSKEDIKKREEEKTIYMIVIVSWILLYINLIYRLM